ncbi:MAG: hypothetical protein JO297_12585 [Nitrososphaeraceae archaeon]|nr:hypothetical protein [Nitrososphaeraceae archaeon]
MFFCFTYIIDVYKRKQQHVPTIRHIPDDPWNEVKYIHILPAEEPIERIGPQIVPVRKVFNGFYMC